MPRRSRTRGTPRPGRSDRRTRRSRRPAPAPVGAFVRLRAGHRVRFAPRVPGLGGLGGAAGGAHDGGARFDRRGEGVPGALGDEPALDRLGDRRHRGQGRPDRSAARAREHEPRAPLGDRLQVPARGTHDAADVDRRAHGSHGQGHAVRRARSGVRQRRHRDLRHAAQRGRGPPQGRAQGRHRDRAPRGRRDPRDRRAGPLEAEEERPAMVDADDLHLLRHAVGPSGR